MVYTLIDVVVILPMLYLALLHNYSNSGLWTPPTVTSYAHGCRQ